MPKTVCEINCQGVLKITFAYSSLKEAQEVRQVSCSLTLKVQALCIPQSCTPHPSPILGVEAELRGKRRCRRQEGPPKPQSPPCSCPS